MRAYDITMFKARSQAIKLVRDFEMYHGTMLLMSCVFNRFFSTRFWNKILICYKDFEFTH